MQDIRKQFSLDWLAGTDKGPSNPSSSLAQSALDEAVIFYGQPILSQLEQAPGGQMGLHDLARALKDDVRDFHFDRLWEVIKHLAGIYMVEIVDASDAAGNYQIRLGRKAS